MDRFVGYRTFIVAVILGVLQVVAVVAPGAILPDPASVDAAVGVMLALLGPLAMVVMRLFTNTSPGEN
jgi:hypothetical protein